MAQFMPDYEHLYMQAEFSDVKIMIQDEDEAAAAPRKRKRYSTARTLPGHCLLLLGHSGYCKAKLENWKDKAGSSSSAKGSKQLEITLLVPAGQLELGELLIKGIYQKHPTITKGLSHQQLLQLMVLADRFEVPKVQAAVAAAFSVVAPQQLEWETALQLLDLPPSCSQQPEFKAVQQLAVQRLQQQLGDLEVVWADDALQGQLCSLPFAALLQLLQHPDTRVATENTVVYTIESWFIAQHAQHPEAPIVKQLRQLMYLVRMRHCTPYYAGTVMPQSTLVWLCFEPSELLLMHVCCSPTAHATLQSHAKCPALDTYPAWSAEQRPASAKQPTFEWHLPLGKVQAAVEGYLGSSSSPILVAASKRHTVQGQPVEVVAKLISGSSSRSSSSSAGSAGQGNTGDSSSKPLALGMYLSLAKLPPNAVRKVSARISLEKVVGAATRLGRRLPEVTERSFSDT